MSIGERVRALRESLGYTQRQVAAMAEMPSQYWSDLERGRNANPSLETLARIAAALDVGVDDLVGHGRPYQPKDLPDGLRELLADPEWGRRITAPWVETLMNIRHQGRE